MNTSQMEGFNLYIRYIHQIHLYITDIICDYLAAAREKSHHTNPASSLQLTGYLCALTAQNTSAWEGTINFYFIFRGLESNITVNSYCTEYLKTFSFIMNKFCFWQFSIVHLVQNTSSSQDFLTHNWMKIVQL